MEELKLTEKDECTLWRARDLEDTFGAGIFGNHNHMQKLVRYGLLEYVCHGPDMDGEKENDQAIYMLTPQGRKAAKEASNG
jgi:hypothetical protein